LFNPCKFPSGQYTPHSRREKGVKYLFLAHGRVITEIDLQVGPVEVEGRPVVVRKDMCGGNVLFFGDPRMERAV